MNTKRNIVLLIVLIVAAALIYMFYPVISSAVSGFLGSSGVALRQEIFSTPLKSSENNEHAQLQAEAVIALTNAERVHAGGAELTENEALNAAAAAKLQDMFEQQYFEHISPQGRGPGVLAAAAGYNYLVVGENLALGNFKDNNSLLSAWMASPGHRENILNTKFTEIGVAVGQGMFQGKKTWLAVQEFGKPASDCPEIEVSLKNQIDLDKQNIAAIEKSLQSKKAELDTAPKNTPQEQEIYNQKVNEYNSLVGEYNTLQKKIQQEVNEYNAQVRAFNSCLKA